MTAPASQPAPCLWPARLAATLRPGRAVLKARPVAGWVVGRPVGLAMTGVVLTMTIALGVASGADAGTLALRLLLAPLLEEAVFRVGLQDALLQTGLSMRKANSITALCFAAGHVLLRGGAWGWAVLLPALVVGAHYGHTRRLRGCVLLHALMNAIWLVAQRWAAT